MCPSTRKEKLESTEISWTVKKSKVTWQQEADTTLPLINRIIIRQATVFGHVMRGEKLEHLVRTGIMEEKQQEEMLDGLTKYWL